MEQKFVCAFTDKEPSISCGCGQCSAYFAILDAERGNYEDKKNEFYIICQEVWETIGYATQLDERFIELLYRRLHKRTK